MRTILALALLAAGLDAAAAETPMLPPSASDQVPRYLVTLAMPARAVSERAPVQFSWALDPNAAIVADPKPAAVESREYWQEVDGADLQRGVGVTTTSPGALIRVSPAADAAKVPADAVRVSRGGREVALAKRSGGEQLRAAGLAANDRTAVVQLAEDASPGRYDVRLAQARGRYVMHVYEPRSDVRMRAALSRDHALAGENGEIRVDLLRGDARMKGAQGGALLVSPSGHSWPLSLTADGAGALRAKLPLPVDAESEPGLWEVQVFANAGDVQRDARTAIAVAQPTAKLDGSYRFDATALRFDLPVQAASPGRYEVRGTLYATGPGNALRPVAIAHSARWIENGAGTVALAFNRTDLPAGYGAPFELRDVELNDQTRLAPVERRTRVARISR